MDAIPDRYRYQVAEVEALRRSLDQSLQDRLSLLEALGTKLENYKANLIPTSERASRLALANYSYGKVDYPTLTAATQAWVNSKVEYEVILTDYLTSIAELEQTIGGDLR